MHKKVGMLHQTLLREFLTTYRNGDHSAQLCLNYLRHLSCKHLASVLHAQSARIIYMHKPKHLFYFKMSRNNFKQFNHVMLLS